jgi:hypothetical protein
MTIAAYEYKREQAQIARREAEELRDLHMSAKCGLDLRMNYGTRDVPRHIVLRIADQFPIWAAEYDALADRLEAEMAAMLVSDHTDGAS